MSRYCEIYSFLSYFEIIVKYNDDYFKIASNTQNAWETRFKIDNLPENAYKIALSAAMYRYLGLPMEERSKT